jgi:probable F420-dependent oxidoreductase
LNVGIVFPHAESGTDPSAIRDFAQAAEALGFSHILAFDHVLGADPGGRGDWSGRYTSSTPFREPLTLFAFTAGITSRIGLATGVLILPQRQTALVAKQAAEVQLLSGGRLRLGVGTGWNKVEYDALQQDFHTRGRREEEQIALLRQLWENDVVTFDGRFDRVDRAGINPRPLNPIPIWLGGRDDAVLRRAARCADGWLPLFAPGAELADALTRLDGYLAAAGRSRDDFGIEGFVNFEPEGAERWAGQLAKWTEAGATHVSLRTMPPGLAAPRPGFGMNWHIEAMRRYRESFGRAWSGSD